ncbi:MAG: ECF transporter S component [Candidatus Saccharicenans sp.]|nr:MAG: ECF transporter S component [Candidatus Aminicenantes bacterium]HEK85164.1 ECF transporter S component [Candidatus Aminicenantes bacterium]
MKSPSEILLGGLFIALALALPIAFHLVGLGSSFLPMFFPIILAGYLLPVRASLVVGLTSPLISALLTGMPPLYPPIAFIMMGEALALVIIPYFFYQKLKMNIWCSLVLTIAGERVVLLLSIILISKWLKLPGVVLGISSLLKGLPGIILTFLVIPPLVINLKRRIMISPFFNQE